MRFRKPAIIRVEPHATEHDLFHKDVPFEFIDKVFAVMALCPQHTFQVLTKRPERMAEYFASLKTAGGHERAVNFSNGRMHSAFHGALMRMRQGYPFPNVHLGTSCENQEAADERIPHLLRCPAEVRFISAEPLLGPVDLRHWLTTPNDMCAECGWVPGEGMVDYRRIHGDSAKCIECGESLWELRPSINWIIAGGESGPGARPCNVEWTRLIVTQCREAGVKCFVKQLGANVRDRNDAGFMGEPGDAWGHNRLDYLTDLENNPDGVIEEYQGAPVRIRLADKKGGDMAEWPEDLRVREMPERAGA